ncbi:hypothetical protein JCM9279_002215 [Rhodotorula babjevae]
MRGSCGVLSLLRPGSRLVASSAQIPLALSTRLYSADAPASPAPRPPRNSHEAQSRPRTRTLRQVGEESGSTAQLVALAVKKTQAQGGDTRHSGFRQQGAGGQAAAAGGQQRGQRPPRQMQRTPEEHREWLKQRLDERRAASSEGGAAPRFSSSPSEGGERRRFGGQRAEGGPRRPRGDGGRPPFGGSSSASGSGAAGRDGAKPRGAFPQRPHQMRRAPRPTAAGPQWSAEATRPLTPPSTVRYPSANLAQLLRADLASKAVQLKCSLGGTKVVNEDADSREERDQAKKLLGGDYSLWLDAGKAEAGEGKAKGKAGKQEGVVEHARGILRTNASVPLGERQVLLNKIREAVL